MVFYLLRRPIAGVGCLKLLANLEESVRQSMPGQHLVQADLHAQEPADVDHCAGVLQQRAEAVNLLIDELMRVDTAAAARLGLAADGGVVVEIVVLRLQAAKQIVIEKIGRIGRSHHQMQLAGARLTGAIQQFHQHAPVRSDPSTGGDKQVVVISGIDGQQESLAVGPGDLQFIAGSAIAEVVAAQAKEQDVILGVVRGLLGFELVDHPLGGGGEDVWPAVFAGTGAGDGEQANLIGLAVLIDAGRNHSERLPDEEVAGQRRARDVHYQMTDEAGGFSLQATVIGHDAAGDRLLHRHQIHLCFREDRFGCGGLLAHSWDTVVE